MSKVIDKIRKWWYFSIANPTERLGGTGAFKWRFRRYFADIKTISGNFSVRVTAAPHPYGYLFNGDDTQVQGYAERLYMVAMLMTTEQQFVNELDKVLSDYEKRHTPPTPVVEDEVEERVAMDEMIALQEHIELPAGERRKVVRDINGRFKKAAKTLNDGVRKED